jgi:hypothetical protein
MKGQTHGGKGSTPRPTNKRRREAEKQIKETGKIK